MRAAARRPPLLLTAAACLVALAIAPARAEKQSTLQLSIHEIGPTQEEVGRAIALRTAEHYLADAKPGGEQSFLGRALQRRIATEPFRAVIDPDGVARILDGHHRAYALQQLSERYGVDLRVRLIVEHDYRGESWRSYAEHLTGELGKGYFSTATRRRHPQKDDDSALRRVRRLPRRIADCKDSPLRSAVGAVFWSHGIDGDHFADYIEFRVADRLRRDPGVDTRRTRLAGRELDLATINTLAPVLLGGSGKRYLLRRARPEHRGRVAEQLGRLRPRPLRENPLRVTRRRP